MTGAAVRLGFWGAGFIARMHTLSLATCPVAHRVTAVHDPDPERAKELAARFGAAVVGEGVGGVDPFDRRGERRMTGPSGVKLTATVPSMSVR